METDAHDRILRWCRTQTGYGEPCMRTRDNGICLVIDVSTSTRANILACGLDWDEVLTGLKWLGIQIK